MHAATHHPTPPHSPPHPAPAVSPPLLSRGQACVPSNYTSLHDRQRLFNDTARALRRAAERLNANGKVLIVSLRDHFANTSLPVGLDHTKSTCPYPEDVLFDALDGTVWVAHREYHPNEWRKPARGVDAATACATTILDWAYEARAAPASLWCTYDIECTPANATCEPFAASLAMFLLGMEANSYFGASGGYNDWPTEEWPWWPAYDRKLGKPKGRLVAHAGGHVFTREFEHANVQVDCARNTSRIQWLG